MPEKIPTGFFIILLNKHVVDPGGVGLWDVLEREEVFLRDLVVTFKMTPILLYCPM